MGKATSVPIIRIFLRIVAMSNCPQLWLDLQETPCVAVHINPVRSAGFGWSLLRPESLQFWLKSAIVSSTMCSVLVSG